MERVNKSVVSSSQEHGVATAVKKGGKWKSGAEGRSMGESEARSRVRVKVRVRDSDRARERERE
eukprot:scaffold208686_cov40-Tisochrysis_lutea.AAC.2